MRFEHILFHLIYMYNTEFIYAKGLNIIPVVLASEEVSLKYVIHYQIEMNFARHRVILQA